MSIAYPQLRHLAVGFAILVPTAHVSLAYAQQQPAGGSSVAGGSAAANGAGNNTAGTGGGGTGTGSGTGAGAGSGAAAAPAGGGMTSTSTATTTVFPGGVAPVPPGGTLGGGNTEFSSSKPITGSGSDTFDFRNGARGQGTAHGSENSSFVLGSGGVRTGGDTNASVHAVRKGDTLWDICDHYFRNPYQWPRIWAFNPQIQNPHWIFPGDQVRLRGAGTQVAQIETTSTGQGLVDRRRQVPAETIFLRTQGYIDEDTNNWGELNGSPEEKTILTDFDEVYLRISSAHDLKVGQELTVYRPLRSIAGGKLIEIQGTVKVTQWNPKDRIARGQIIEALDAIERGARVGPVTRRFEVVAPTRNDKDIVSTLLTSVQPHGLLGQNQIVFIDQGEEAGVKPGNRFFVIRKGDGWHQTQTTNSSSKRIALEEDSPAATEDIPKPRDPSRLPEDVLAELRIINVRKHTSMAIVTSSRKELEAGDKAFARKGY
ncbi:MAG: hypothetical protein JWP97_2473 [Labilithrix sp.]|nr:hypothetical protein [Labilithrix sp.]